MTTASPAATAPEVGVPEHVQEADGRKRKTTNPERAAYRAHRRLRMLAPMLSDYASDLIGREVKVKPGKSTQTDGETIWIEPPFELARPINHGDCENDAENCEGCATMDIVMSSLHHEIAHIMHGSFDKFVFTHSTVDSLVRRMSKHTPVTQTYNLNYHVTFAEETAMYVAASTYLPMSMFFMALEDHRVNEASFKLWPRLRELNLNECEKIMASGIQHPDGSTTKWGDRSRDDQMMIMSLMTLTGVDCTGKLDDEVIADYKGAGILEITKGVESARNSRSVLDITADAMAPLIAKGYFTNTDDDAIQALIALLKMLFGHGVSGIQLGEGGEPIDCEGSKDPRLGTGNGEGARGINATDDITEEQFREAYDTVIEGAVGLDGPALGIAGVKLFGPGKGEAWGSPSNIMDADPSARNRAVSKARLIFEENSRVEYHRNQRRGKINGRALGKRAWSGDDRLFSKRTVPDTRTYEVLIGLDISGSTLRGPLDVIRSTANAMADVCHRAGINFEIMAHTGERLDREIFATVYQIKDLKQRWDTETRSNLAKINGGGGNLDGHTMQFYRKRLDASSCTDKIMFYFTDGAMPAGNGVNERPILVRELELMKRRGYHVVGVGIGTDSPKEFGMDTVIVNGPNDIGAVLDRLATKFKRK